MIYGASQTGKFFTSGATYIFVYDGTNFKGIHSYDSNTTYSSMSISEGTTGTATSKRVLTAANLKGIINAHAPMKDGTGATGNWGINITGNANTATEFKNTTDMCKFQFGGVLRTRPVGAGAHDGPRHDDKSCRPIGEIIQFCPLCGQNWRGVEGAAPYTVSSMATRQTAIAQPPKSLLSRRRRLRAV